MTAVCLTGCSSNDDSEPKLNGQTPRPMYVEVSGVSRTAAQTTTETLSTFAVHYLGNRYKYIKEGEKWSTGTWPTDVANDQKIDFYADTYTYNDTHSTSYNYNNGNPYIHFTVDGNASSQHDLLVSECKQVSYAETEGHVIMSRYGPGKSGLILIAVSCIGVARIDRLRRNICITRVRTAVALVLIVFIIVAFSRLCFLCFLLFSFLLFLSLSFFLLLSAFFFLTQSLFFLSLSFFLLTLFLFLVLYLLALLDQVFQISLELLLFLLDDRQIILLYLLIVI